MREAGRIRPSREQPPVTASSRTPLEARGLLGAGGPQLANAQRACDTETTVRCSGGRADPIRVRLAGSRTPRLRWAPPSPRTARRRGLKPRLRGERLVPFPSSPAIPINRPRGPTRLEPMTSRGGSRQSCLTPIHLAFSAGRRLWSARASSRLPRRSSRGHSQPSSSSLKSPSDLWRTALRPATAVSPPASSFVCRLSGETRSACRITAL